MTGGSWPVLSALNARVLRATDARYERSPEKVGELAGCVADWRYLRCVGSASPTSWRTTAAVRSGGFAHRGDVALEHAP
jgi:hypothetical protein